MTDIAYILFTELGSLDADIEYIKKVKLSMTEVFVNLHSKSYHVDKGGPITLNHGRFVKAIEAVMDYRRGIRRMSESQGPEAVAEAVAEHASSCSVS